MDASFTLYLLNTPGSTLPQLRERFPWVTAQLLYRLHRGGQIIQKGAPHCYEYYSRKSAKLTI